MQGIEWNKEKIMSMISSSEETLYNEAKRLQSLMVQLMADDTEFQAQLLIEERARQLLEDVIKLADLAEWVEPGLIAEELLHSASDRLITMLHAKRSYGK